MIEWDESRRQAAKLLEAALAEELVQRSQSVAAYTVGSGAADREVPSRDFDLLFVDLERAGAPAEVRLQVLFDSLAQGDPFAAAFDTSDEPFKQLLGRALTKTNHAVPALRTMVSYAFGPARAEVGIAEDAWHVHVSGPLTKGDLVALSRILPFHVAAFRRYHRTIFGPSLLELMPAPELNGAVVRRWDELLARRIDMLPSVSLQRKWIERMLKNRRELAWFTATHPHQIERLERRVGTLAASEVKTVVAEIRATAEGCP